MPHAPNYITPLPIPSPPWASLAMASSDDEAQANDSAVLHGLGFDPNPDPTQLKKPKLDLQGHPHKPSPFMHFVKASTSIPSEQLNSQADRTTTESRKQDLGSLPRSDNENENGRNPPSQTEPRPSQGPPRPEERSSVVNEPPAAASRWGDASSGKSGTNSGKPAALGTNPNSVGSKSKKSKEAKALEKKSEAVLEKMKRRGFAQFESSGTGFGSKYLAKMGFTGRLGKQTKGISEPIAVVVRPKNMGIGFGDFTEANELPENKRIDRLRKGDVAGEDDELSDKSDDGYVGSGKPFKPYKGDQPLDHALRGLWKDARRSSKRERRSNATLDRGKNVQSVVDMTGRHARLVTDMKQLKSGTMGSSSEESSSESGEESESSEGSESAASGGKMTLDDEGANGKNRWKRLFRMKRFGREFVYNVKSLADLKDAEVAALQQQKSRAQAQKETLRQRVDALTASLQISANEVQRMKQLHARLSSILATVTNGTPTLDTVTKSLLDVRNEFPMELQNMPGTFSHIVTGIATRFVQGSWSKSQPRSLSDAAVGAYEQLFNSFGEALPSDKDRGAFIAQLGSELHAQMLSQIKRGWAKDANKAAVIALLHLLGREEGMKDISKRLREEVVMPMLLADVSVWKWDPVTGRTLDQLIAPWYRLGLRKEIRHTIHREVRLKLESTVGKLLRPGMSKEESKLAVKLVEPWRNLFSVETFGKLVDRAIMPRLVTCLEKTEINPANQDTTAFDTVMEFSRFIQASRIVALLLSVFMPKWLRVLQKWLAHAESHPQLNDILQWYIQWKSAFPMQLISSEPQLWQQFDTALVLIERKIAGEDREISTHQFPDLAYTQVLKKIVLPPEIEAEAKGNHGANEMGRGPEERKRDEKSTREFREVVSELAEAYGMTLMRHEKEKQKDGKPVYVLNERQVYFHENVLWMKDAERPALWHPTELRTCFTQT